MVYDSRFRCAKFSAAQRPREFDVVAAAGPPQDHLLHLDHVLRVAADQDGLLVRLGAEIAMRLRRLSVLPYFNMFPVIESRNAYTAAKSPNRAGRHRRTRGIGRRWRNWWEFRWTRSGDPSRPPSNKHVGAGERGV